MRSRLFATKIWADSQTCMLGWCALGATVRIRHGFLKHPCCSRTGFPNISHAVWCMTTPVAPIFALFEIMKVPYFAFFGGTMVNGRAHFNS